MSTAFDCKMHANMRAIQVYRQSKDAKQQESAPVAGNGASSGPDNGNGNKPQNLKLTDQYIALLIVVFANAGILEVRTLPSI